MQIFINPLTKMIFMGKEEKMFYSAIRRLEKASPGSIEELRNGEYLLNYSLFNFSNKRKIIRLERVGTYPQEKYNLSLFERDLSELDIYLMDTLLYDGFKNLNKKEQERLSALYDLVTTKKVKEYEKNIGKIKQIEEKERKKLEKILSNLEDSEN